MTGLVPHTDYARPASVDRSLTTLYGVAIEHKDPLICNDLVEVGRYVVQLERRLASPATASWWNRIDPPAAMALSVAIGLGLACLAFWSGR